MNGKEDIAATPGLSTSLMDQVRKLELMHDGWDGEGSEAPKEPLLSLVRSILAKLVSLGADQEPTIHPAPGGNVDLCWERQKVYCSLYTDFVFTMGKYGPEVIHAEHSLPVDNPQELEKTLELIGAQLLQWM